ncbi:MAG: GGDEF domain-containing protein [Methylococcaceae bacterium]
MNTAMPVLDIPTAYGFSATLILVYGVSMLIYARKMSNRFNGLNTFANAILLMAFGVALVSLRGHIPFVISLLGGNTLIGLSSCLLCRAHLEFINAPKPSRIPNAPLLGVLIALLLLFTFILPNSEYRSLALSAFYCSQFFSIAFNVQRLQQQTGQTQYKSLSSIAAVMAAFLALRFIALLFSDQPRDSLAVINGLPFASIVIILVIYIATLNLAIILITSGQLIQQLSDLANQDSMTKLYNRRGLEHQIANGTHLDHVLALILCDLDHFKAINDHYGHHVGDLVLQNIANLLKRSTRVTDICTRWGGEEFLILLPLTEVNAAFNIAEKIRNAVEQLIIPEYPELRLTCSFGISTSHNSSLSLDQIAHQADISLYEAKKQGRNRICIYNANTLA